LRMRSRRLERWSEESDGVEIYSKILNFDQIIIYREVWYVISILYNKKQWA
jgi:hypothetical protein